MLQNIKILYGNKLAAIDGIIGHVKDFYFDDKAWAIRYLVANTGTWLSGKLVLLSPHAFGSWDREEHVLHVNLTRTKIEESPSPETHQPVSRQYEEDYHRYYGWPNYWQGLGMWGLSGFPLVTPRCPRTTHLTTATINAKTSTFVAPRTSSVIKFRLRTGP